MEHMSTSLLLLLMLPSLNYDGTGATAFVIPNSNNDARTRPMSSSSSSSLSLHSWQQPKEWNGLNPNRGMANNLMLRIRPPMENEYVVLHQGFFNSDEKGEEVEHDKNTTSSKKEDSDDSKKKKKRNDQSADNDDDEDKEEDESTSVLKVDNTEANTIKEKMKEVRNMFALNDDFEDSDDGITTPNLPKDMKGAVPANAKLVGMADTSNGDLELFRPLQVEDTESGEKDETKKKKRSWFGRHHKKEEEEEEESKVQEAEFENEQAIVSTTSSTSQEEETPPPRKRKRDVILNAIFRNVEDCDLIDTETCNVTAIDDVDVINPKTNTQDLKNIKQSLRRILEREISIPDGSRVRNNILMNPMISAPPISSSSSSSNRNSNSNTDDENADSNISPRRGLIRRFLSPRGFRGKLKYVTLVGFFLLTTPIPKRFMVEENVVSNYFPQRALDNLDKYRYKAGPKYGGGGGSSSSPYGSQQQQPVIPRERDPRSRILDEAPSIGAPAHVDSRPGDNGKQRNYASSFVAQAVRKIGPSVIRIDTERYVDNYPGMPGRGPFSGPSSPFDFYGLGEGSGGGNDPRKDQQIEQGQGSGIIFSRDGLVLTNAHVVENVNLVRVTLTDGRRYVAEVKGVDEMVDLAVLQLLPSVMDPAAASDAPSSPENGAPSQPSMEQCKGYSEWDENPLPVAPLGDSDSIQVGEWALAVGNPVGLDNTVTMGIVSSVKRSSAEVGIPNKKVEFIQTDAAINPGNSGGPLVNEHGDIIGINTCIRANAEGIGFAIPINKAKSIMYQLAAGENIKHGYIGIVMTTVTPDFARQNNDNPNSAAGIIPEVNGAMIIKVVSNTPASSCGLRRFDVVLEIGGNRVHNAAEAQEVVDASVVGEDLEIKVLRGDREMKLVVQPGDLSEKLRAAKEAKQREQQQQHTQRLPPGFSPPMGPDGEGGGGKVYIFPFPGP
eukprot:CAMPEP_0195523592 /NCGR_PEP_ID=MMETSP0794_2-20130614/22850_1 /TAXON_ID=515487 /ORGANISM="Stephanopyxis turris, Strain CCMP 815" /LENGTH=947 /DNA_ID=CAMNT_0040653617 /DNA_START=290 /DNA_END=3133 /DNA_ORIENTATION=-